MHCILVATLIGFSSSRTPELAASFFGGIALEALSRRARLAVIVFPHSLPASGDVVALWASTLRRYHGDVTAWAAVGRGRGRGWWSVSARPPSRNAVQTQRAACAQARPGRYVGIDLRSGLCALERLAENPGQSAVGGWPMAASRRSLKFLPTLSWEPDFSTAMQSPRPRLTSS